MIKKKTELTDMKIIMKELKHLLLDDKDDREDQKTELLEK